MRKSILALTAAAVALAGTAYAQQQGAFKRGGDPLGDATLTRAEASAKAAAMFDRLDANHDGKLDQADRAARMAQMFDRIDTNHDGSISRDEFMAAHERMGMGRRMGGHGPEGMEHGGMGHAGMGHEGMGHDGMGHDDGDHGPMAGKSLTRDAFVAEAMRRFDAADTNHDGKVTKEERRAAFRARRAQMMGRDHPDMMSGPDMMGGPEGMGGPDMPPPPPPGK